MKFKTTTYLLIVAVVAVWGVVVWKVLHPAPPDTPQRTASQRSAAATTAPDTLLLDYRDPFLDGYRTAPVAPAPGPVLRPLPPAPAPKKAVKHNVLYRGRIRRQGVEYSLVEINGAQHTMKVGETTDDYRLERIFPDSLHLVFDGDRCCIKLAQ